MSSVILESRQMKLMGYYYFLKELWLTRIFKEKYPDVVYPIIRILCLNEGDDVRSKFVLDYIPLSPTDNSVRMCNERIDRLMHSRCIINHENVTIRIHEKSFLLIVPLETNLLAPPTKIVCMGQFNKVDNTTGYYLAYEIEAYLKEIRKSAPIKTLFDIPKAVKKCFKHI